VRSRAGGRDRFIVRRRPARFCTFDEEATNRGYVDRLHDEPTHEDQAPAGITVFKERSTAA
jgi:hypothetical protein